MAKQWKRSLSGDDVQAEAEDALEKDIANMSPASNSVAANLDGGVAAVDWSSKTLKTSAPTVGSHQSNTHLNISGSGFFVTLYVAIRVDETFTIQFDGGDIYEVQSDGGDGLSGIFSAPVIPFSSSIKIAGSRSPENRANAWVVVD